MLKKLGIAALLVAGAFAVLGKLDLLWHVKDGLRKAKAEIRANVPAEDKVARLRDELNRLAPEKKKYLGMLAEESVRIERLERDLVASKSNLEKSEQQIQTLRTALETSTAEHISISGSERLPREKVKDSLARRWESFREAEAAHTSQQQLLARRKEKLEAAQAKLRTMEAKERDLRVKLDKLEIELARLRDAQLVNDIPIEDNQFTHVIQLFDELEGQIAKEKKELELTKGASTDTQVEEALDRRTRVEKAMREMDERFTRSARGARSAEAPSDE